MRGPVFLAGARADGGVLSLLGTQGGLHQGSRRRTVDYSGQFSRLLETRGTPGSPGGARRRAGSAALGYARILCGTESGRRDHISGRNEKRAGNGKVNGRRTIA